MDLSPHLSLTHGPSAPRLESILRPITLESAPPIQSFLPVDGVSLETASISSAMPQSMVLAQQFDQDILGDLGKVWNTFIESGQVWALIIGIVIGYMVRSLTAY
ncbi:MAG: hypothetical protein VKI82_16010 [Leptolyngbya sp.]|nr:hypothetical protein [Leptolyngbya sp.]